MLLSKKIKVVILLSLLLISVPGLVNAQIRISSPYSRYGLGDLQSNVFSRNMAMGGIGYALRDNHLVNIKNPASYTEFDSLSFVCEIGITTDYNQLQTTDITQGFNNYTTMGYLLFGFPVTRWWGASIGLVPYSNVGYSLTFTDSMIGAGKSTGQYQGTGGLNRFNLGSGFRLYRDLSVGFNASFLFGTISNTGANYFDDLTYVFDTRISNILIINNFNFEAGLQYHHALKHGLYINGGLVYEIPFNMAARKTYLVERFTATAPGENEVTQDTVENIVNQKGKIHLPGGIGGGLAVGKKDIWMASLDFAWQNWSNYRSFGQKDSLKSSWNGAIGLMLTPQHNSVSSYFKRMTYRAGFRYDNSYLMLRNNFLGEYAVSVGLGFPIRKSSYSINVALEYGQRGTIKDNLIKESFIRGTVGFAIKESWFYRKKLD